MVMDSGTIIHMSSIRTDGETASFPSVRVCCVAMTSPAT